MSKKVDSLKFVGGLTKRLVRSWRKLEPEREIPWTPLKRPLAQSTIALITSGAVALKDDKPFDQQGERDNPWWGDPSYRIIPHGTRAADIKVYHLHIEPSFAESDLNCLLPNERLDELVAAGTVGKAAPRHYSTMGYILDPEVLLTETTPAIIDHLREDEVDGVVLIPA